MRTISYISLLLVGALGAGCGGAAAAPVAAAPVAVAQADDALRFDLPRAQLDELLAGYLDSDLDAQDTGAGVRVDNLPPAVKALGLHDGDVLVELNGLVIGSGDDLRSIHARLIGAEHLYLEVERGGERVVLRYTLRGEGEAFRPRAEELSDEDLAALLDVAITKIDDVTYEVRRDALDRLMANPLAASKGARVTPSLKNGKANGIKFYAIRPSSIYARLGLANGDTLHSVNGVVLDDLDDGLAAYQQARNASTITLSVTRRGKPVTLTYLVQ